MSVLPQQFVLLRGVAFAMSQGTVISFFFTKMHSISCIYSVNLYWYSAVIFLQGVPLRSSALQILKLWLHTIYFFVCVGGRGKEKTGYPLSKTYVKCWPWLCYFDCFCFACVYRCNLSSCFLGFFAVVPWIIFCSLADHWLNCP